MSKRILTHLPTWSRPIITIKEECKLTYSYRAPRKPEYCATETCIFSHLWNYDHYTGTVGTASK